MIILIHHDLYNWVGRVDILGLRCYIRQAGLEVLIPRNRLAVIYGLIQMCVRASALLVHIRFVL